MLIKSVAAVLISSFAITQAAAQQPQPNIQILAQAYDRCMATHAVRLTKTAALDAEIYVQASQSCLPLDSQLRAAISAQIPPEQAVEVLRSIDASAEPNFMAMLAQIRSDRARNAGG